MRIPALHSCVCGHRGFEHDPQTADCLHHACRCDQYQHASYQPPGERGQARRRRGTYAGMGQAPRDDR